MFMIFYRHTKRFNSRAYPDYPHRLCRLVASQVHCTLAKLLMLQFLPSPQICWLFCVHVCVVCVPVCVHVAPQYPKIKLNFHSKRRKYCLLCLVPRVSKLDAKSKRDSRRKREREREEKLITIKRYENAFMRVCVCVRVCVSPSHLFV